MSVKIAKVESVEQVVSKSVLDNRIDYIKSVSAVFKHHAVKMHGYCQEDRNVVNETITQLDYVVILLKRLKEMYGDDVPEQYRFNMEISSIHRLTHDLVSETFIDGLMSITMVSKVNKISQSVIERYHNIMIPVSFWKRWIK